MIRSDKKVIKNENHHIGAFYPLGRKSAISMALKISRFDGSKFPPP